MFDPEVHRRRSLRLRGYDYAAAGYSFVTLCIQHNEPLLGKIVSGTMVPNDAGQMVENIWRKLPGRFPNVALDKYIVMPNHFHGIIVINDTDPVGADPRVCPGPNNNADSEKPGGHMGPSKAGGHTGPPLPRIMQWFKTMTTNHYIHGVKQNHWPPFAGKFWQRNYYDRVIRNQAELRNISQYIRNNPQQWENNKD